MLLTANAAQFRASGAEVHTTFQGLSAVYRTPDAVDLLSSTQPVKAKADAFADDLEKAAMALSDYSAEVQPLVERLATLKADATAFVQSLSGDEDWRKDQDKVDRNNELWRDVNHTVAAFQAAERACHNKITALVGGSRITVDDGSHGEHMYGYRADDLDHAPETPWGAPAEREYEGWDWLTHQAGQVWDGFWTDGVMATVHGVGTLFGADGSDAAGEAWKGLAKLATASALTSATMGTWWLVPDDKLPSWLRESRTTYKQTVKGFVAWDTWKTNPSRAAGAVGFNVLTTLGGTEGAGAAASAAGRTSAGARALSMAGKVGRAIDPMTYVGKAGTFAFGKVGDAFRTLKDLHSGTTLDLLEHTDAVRSPKIPDNAIPFVDEATGKIVYLTDEGHLFNADGTLHQHADEAATELAAGDRALLNSASRASSSGHQPGLVPAHGGADQVHGASASHEPPSASGGGHPDSPGAGRDHAPPGHETTPAGDHGGSGPDMGGHGEAMPPGGHEPTSGVALPEQPPGHEPMVRGGETEQQLRDAIKQIPGDKRPKPDVLDRALERLATVPNGQQVAEIIASGRFGRSDGFGQVVSSLGARKEAMFQPGVDQIIFAEDLARSGVPAQNIEFEYKIPAGADADIRITDESGSVYTYQMKHLNNPIDQVSEITRGKYLLQLAVTEADHRVMLVDGGRGTRADWMANGSYDALMDIHNGGRGRKGQGITFVVRLEDGTLVIPPGAKTDPKDML
ncbi:hypothetical protein ACIBVL_34530 [Streptomyces sp. NPDC049687]|uniref:hypothetical protein n=1 Tax=Streptomyces sp. NPDC049687 TaxID=3365596 RepID=UPI0037AB918B